MSLAPDDVRRIAHLARLAVLEGDIPDYARSLSDILTFVEKMDGIDTHGISPMAHPQDAIQRLRPDVVAEPDVREKVQAIAPAVEADLYLVPKVIE